MEEICTNLRTPARPAASAISADAARSTVSLRAAPLPGPAPAANTTASAWSRLTATSSRLADSRSQTTGAAPVAVTSAAWSGLRISPTTPSPRAASSLSRWRAIFPCPPAMTILMRLTTLSGRDDLPGDDRSSDLQHDLAPGMALGVQALSVGRLGEREGLRDGDGEPSVVGQARERGEIGGIRPHEDVPPSAFGDGR